MPDFIGTADEELSYFFVFLSNILHVNLTHQIRRDDDRLRASGSITPRAITFAVSAFSLLWAFLAPEKLSAASLISEPVGCVRVTIPAPAPGESNRKVLGVPFNRPSLYRASLVSAAGTTLKCGSLGWQSGQFVQAPHFLKIRSGTNQGRYFSITGNTLDSVTVNATGFTFAAKDAFEIFPAQTLGSLFGTTSSTVALRSGTLEAQADLVRLRSGPTWITYFFNGTQWRTPGSTASQNNTLIQPEQGILLVCGGTSAVSLSLLGNISITPEMSAVPGSGEALLSPRFPVQTTLSALNLQSLTGWIKGATASLSDHVMKWNGASWNIYYHTGARWQMAGSNDSQDSASIVPGESLLIHRKDGSTGASVAAKSLVPFAFKVSE